MEALRDKEEKNDLKTGEHRFMTDMKAKTKVIMNVEALDQETIRDVERMVILRVSTKHINLRTRQLKRKRREIGEQAGLLKIYGVKKEIETEKSLEKWAKRNAKRFTRKTKRMLFGEIDNIV